VEKPGVYEVPLGTTYCQLLELAGGMQRGRTLRAFCPSGPTYGIHPPAHLDEPSNFGRFDDDKPRVGSGAVIFIDDTRCLIDVALNLTQFFRNESCGKCVPCRIGSSKMADLIQGISKGVKPPAFDRDQDIFPSSAGPGGAEKGSDMDCVQSVVVRLALTLNITSLCGLGQVVHMPIASVLEYWPAEVRRHLESVVTCNVCNQGRHRP